eukprot:TRINITY_DN18411_c0_g3_i2.p1 TRINITY_DN18411_c0_g3~~TRINITY_DN18411_c0_g3_i2.p1  ORF type:complete len:599 (+),score=132.10 TRINITY_DN18411_c0_g3_i2:132-1928(+)
MPPPPGSRGPGSPPRMSRPRVSQWQGHSAAAAPGASQWQGNVAGEAAQAATPAVACDEVLAANDGDSSECATDTTRSLPASDEGDEVGRATVGRLSTHTQGDALLRVLSVASEFQECSSGFIRTCQEEEDELMLQAAPTCSRRIRKVLRQITRHPAYSSVSGCAVLLDFVAICRDADSTAGTERPQELFAVITMNSCFVFYVVDLCARLCAHGCEMMKTKPYMLDLFVICVSVFEYALELLGTVQTGSSLLMIRMVRLCRLLRLLRVVKLFQGMKELRRLCQMIATSARTMFWSFLMSFLIMSMWSVVAVEMVYPVAQRLLEQGTWTECERCGRAFESVMAANLTFFQTILAGDSWGMLALPIMEEEPLTAIVFCGALVTLTYGIMQLITAVVVDSFADLRKLDVNQLAAEKDAEEKEEKKFLTTVFKRLDADCSGQVTCQELIDGVRRIKEFQDWLRVMDIDSNDLGRLFRMLDDDDSGDIDLNEFIDCLYRLKNADPNTTAKLVKHMIENVEKATDQLLAKVGTVQDRIQTMERVQREQLVGAGTSRSASKEEDMTSSLKEMEAAVQRGCVFALEAALSAAADSMTLMKTTGQRSG